MKAYLLQFFEYNDWANTTLLKTILQLPDRKESVQLFSHLIHSQDKWFNRMTLQKPDTEFSWMGSSFTELTLLKEWKRSFEQWHTFLKESKEEELDNDIIFTKPADGKKMKVSVKDVLLQLNYHSIHHRAQINKLVSSQGVAVPATDYIFTALREA
jgi:uncharacterized damage-inducible protein DinB